MVGDSGSPSFGLVNGVPALVGVHLAASDAGQPDVTTVDTFVPHYIETLNGILSVQGYRMTSSSPASVTLFASVSHPVFRQAEAASASFLVSNSSANLAANVRFALDFPLNALPDAVVGTGWIVTNPSSGRYELRRASLTGNSSSTITAIYSSVPSVGEISVSTIRLADGSASTDQLFSIPVAETFGGFVAALSQKGSGDDPDLDGIPNLLEYAFGGDPAVASQTSGAGVSPNPVTSLDHGFLVMKFPRRTDATARGLTYKMTFSDDLISFENVAPAGFTISAAAFSPAVAGYEQVIARIPTDGGKQFMRVEVVLASGG